MVALGQRCICEIQIHIIHHLSRFLYFEVLRISSSYPIDDHLFKCSAMANYYELQSTVELIVQGCVLDPIHSEAFLAFYQLNYNNYSTLVSMYINISKLIVWQIEYYYFCWLDIMAHFNSCNRKMVLWPHLVNNSLLVRLKRRWAA